jgi:hypothetical protein
MTEMVMNKTPPVIMFAVIALSARSEYKKTWKYCYVILTSIPGSHPMSFSPA